MAGESNVRRIYLPPWRIDLTVRAGAPVLLPGAALARAVRAALEAAGAPSPASIGLILSNDAELASLNAAHMGKQEATDVLSFPLLPPEVFPPHEGRSTGGASLPPFPLPPGTRVHLGDIVVSVERAIEQATEGRGGQTGDIRWSPPDELRLLVVHGALHVCGWDHEDADEETAMRAQERRVITGSR